MAWLGGRYRVVARSGLLAREGYLAGSDGRRREELSAAMCDPSIRAIVAARGGYGTTRILASLPWEEFAASPKWMVGFSDVTALHARAWRMGVASVHGPNVTGLGRSTAPAERLAWMDAIEGRSAPAWGGLTSLARGPAAEGPIIGGNLALLETLAAAGELVIPHGAVLAIEDVTERPYRIDRMLTALAAGGYLARASAVVCGGFDRCEPAADGVAVEDVLRDRLGTLGVPVVSGAPFGHGVDNRAFILGARVRVASDTVTFREA